MLWGYKIWADVAAALIGVAAALAALKIIRSS
jgi:hypothetical protein